MKTWLFLNNPFLSAAQKSYRQGLKLSTYYNAQLLNNIGDPFFAALFAIYNPLHLEVKAAYANWLAQGGTLKGETLTVVQLLKLLSSTKVNAWDHAVTGIFIKGTPQHLALFPQGHKPFYNGSKEMRIAAVQQFSTALTGIVALAALKIDVDSFLAQLNSDRDTQLGGKGETKGKSQLVEKAIDKAMVVMYGHFGSMILKFQDNPLLIEQYFDVATIRSHQQLIYTKTVKAAKVRNIVQHTFAEDDTITLVNNGTVMLYFYLAPNKTAPMEDLTTVKIEPNTEQTVEIADLGDLTNTFLNVYNSQQYDGHCIVELM